MTASVKIITHQKEPILKSWNPRLFLRLIRVSFVCINQPVSTRQQPDVRGSYELFQIEHQEWTLTSYGMYSVDRYACSDSASRQAVWSGIIP